MITESFTRRRFLAESARFGAVWVAAEWLPLPMLAQSLATDSRVAERPLVDRGFALVRQIGKGVYATVSDRAKGMQTRCNGGFLVGRDAALVIEGFQTPTGAAFQVDALRMVSSAPIRTAINTHFHFDHCLGNSYYGANEVPIWAHKKAASRIMETYPRMQSTDRTAFLAPWEQRVRQAKTDRERQHAQSDLEGLANMFDPVKQYTLALPNHALDLDKQPITIDLGGLSVIIEAHVGHTDTDLIIRVPDQNVVFTGDLLVNTQYPTNINGFPSPWRTTLAKFLTFDKDTIFVPGHGQICGMEAVALLIEIFDDIASQARRLRTAGVPIHEATERYVVPDKWKDFRMFSWGFSVGRTMAQLYAEWGTPTEPLSY